MKPLPRSAAGYLCLAALFSMAAHRVEASVFFVSPIRVELSAARPTMALTVQNDSDESLVIQTQPVSWSQSNGDEVHERTADLIVTPALFTIAPRSSQVVRVGLRRPVDSSSEISYRLSLQEIAGQNQNTAASLRMLLRIVLPVFVKPPGATAAKLSWEAQLSADNLLTVRTQNEGNAHIQIYGYKLLYADSKQPFAAQSTPAYVLPGQGRQWQFKPEVQLPDSTGRLHLVASTDAGEIDAEIALDMP